MADWSKPALGDLYENFLQFLKDRDVDLATMFAGSPTNIPVGAVRWNDANKRLEKWSGSAWTVLPIGVTGGGTGAQDAVAARTALSVPSSADLNNHAGAQTSVHGSTNTPTANRLPQYDGSGRLKSNVPATSNDVARKAETDNLSTALSAHSGAASPHIGHATYADLAAHSGSTSNPHGVTALQVGAPPSGRTITAGNGLTGGGDLSADRSLVLGTPSTLSGSTSNGVTSASHTHALSMASQAQAEGGSDSSVLMSPLRARQAIDARASFVHEYVSADQVISDGGSFVLHHGLGGVPKMVRASLVCQAAEFGYAVGDEVSIEYPSASGVGQAVFGLGLVSRVDLILVKYTSPAFFILVNLFTGVYQTAVTANWRLRVRAWR